MTINDNSTKSINAAIIDLQNQIKQLQHKIGILSKNQLKEDDIEFPGKVDVVEVGNMHAVTSNAVASLFSTISEEKILQDNDNVKVSYTIWGKIIIFLVYAKTTFDSSISIDIPLISTPEGVKGSLSWFGKARGETYLRNNGTEIAINTTGESSGQVVWFIA